MQLRPYQDGAKQAILNAWKTGQRKTLLSMPTGSGKTIVFSSVVEEQVNKGHRVLVMAHRNELLEQAADKLHRVSGLSTALEKAESTAIGDPSKVVIGSVQSMSSDKRLARFPADYFQDIIVDEAHHCLSDSYQKVLTHFPKANVLGVTATPDRGDMRALSEYFDSMAYEYTLIDAIKDGWLCPIRSQMIPLKLNISNVHLQNGDFAAGEIGTALDPYLPKIAEQMKKYCKGRKTVVFLPLVKTSKKFCALLNKNGFKAAEINGKSTDRAEKLEAFDKGKYNVLCNSMLLTEGWDCPSVDCIIVLRPTKSRPLFQQMVGRGTRPSPGKKELLLLDFLWLTAKHDLCRPSSLISSNEDIAKRINKKIAENEDGILLLDAEEQAERDIVAEREAALAAQLEAMRSQKETTSLVDPLQYSVSISAERILNYAPLFMWELKPPTEAQKNYLVSMGLSVQNVTTAGYASTLIAEAKARRQRGLASPKQIRCLEKFGFRKVGEWQFVQANEMIGRIADNGWAVPNGITPGTYAPQPGVKPAPAAKLPNISETK